MELTQPVEGIAHSAGRVVLVAATQLIDTPGMTVDPGVTDADALHEYSGRECYQSHHKPNPKTAANRDYLANVIRQNHTSVLAHASFTFRLTGVSRSLTHELIRHRFLAVSEVSQRYVDMNVSQQVIPPLFRGNDFAETWIGDVETHAVGRYNDLVDHAVAHGATRKQAREAARCVLPGGTETKMIVSGNVRAWRDFIAQRNAPGADAEIREIAGAILDTIREYAPNSVADLVEASSE